MEKIELLGLGYRAAKAASESSLDQNVYLLFLPGCQPKILLDEGSVYFHTRRGWYIVAIYRNGRGYFFDGLIVKPILDLYKGEREMEQYGKVAFDRRDLLEMYNIMISLFPVYPSSFKLGQAFMCSELLVIPFDSFLSDFGFTEDEFINFI